MKNNRRKIYVSIGVILSVMTLMTVFAFRQEAQTNNPNQTNPNQANQQEQDDPPTPIQVGVMSEKQRKNSRKFNLGLKTKLPDKVRNRDIQFVVGKPFRALEPPAGNLPSQDLVLQQRVCNSQMIVAGSVVSKSSQLSESLDLVFTDYEIALSKIFRNTSGLNIAIPSIITISRSGGSVLINGRLLKVVDKSYATLKVGKEYIFFLTYIQDSATLVPSSVEGTFEIQGNRIFRHKQVRHRRGFEDSNAFANLLTQTAQQCPN